MSGIGGVLHLDGRAVDASELERLQQALLHRGRDRQGAWREGCVGLVHNLLEIAPEPEQPFSQGGCCLALDGRIDNLPQLSRLLRRSGSRLGEEPAAWRGSASSRQALGDLPEPGVVELLLEGYRQLGERLLPLLVGDFALALWDGRSGRLLLARDPMGLKPLFYHADPRRLIFASEAKGILALPGVPREPDPVRLREFDAFRFRSPERSFFLGIRRLLPGECLTAERGAVRRRIFWEPNPSKTLALPREQYRARFRELFVEAVRCRLPREGLAAIRLSGGLDSSSIAGAAAQVRREQRPGLALLAHSILSDRIPDERAHIRVVCEAHGIESASFLAESQGLLDGIERALYHQESPFFEAIDTWILRQHREAAARGARVVLGGEWGDQLTVSGAYLADLLLEGSWGEFWREFRPYPTREGGTHGELLRQIFWYLVLPARIADRYEGLRHLLRRLALPWRPVAPGGPRFPSAAQRERYDAVFGTMNVLSLEMLDRVAAQCGVEARLPFLDRRLVSFALAVPWREFVGKAQGRWLERESLDGILPPSIARRRDKGDYTELERGCLAQAGFARRGRDPLDLWRSRMKKEWEELWLRRKANPPGSVTSRLALSSTGT